MKDLIRTMKALSDPNRITVMKMLEVRELCVCEITAILGLAQSTVSKHLKLLEDAGLIKSQRDGAWVIYRLAEKQDNPYAPVMQQHLKEWLTEDDHIRDNVAKIATIDRLRICAA
ncbi:MAG: metalloregulator ArsR/SmtB family transcription factor [Proteobacteria bacterium]|nr:metalloregulator ArsR/SmtB family transcription factor [Pseudomonadota bacterium]MBU1687829.1 metalloregulator ArsR/SmtB family transcription factor [Pseudomonadota bacterium]